MGSRKFIIVGFLVACVNLGFSQDERSLKLDSLKFVYTTQAQRQEDPVLLYEIARSEKLSDSVLKYNEKAISILEAADSVDLLQSAYLTAGVHWRLKGEFDKSLDFLFKSAEVAEKMQDYILLGIVNVEIGNTYSESGNFLHSATYLDRGLEFIKNSGDTLLFGKALFNVGDDLLLKGQLDSALVYTEEALDIFKQYDKALFHAYSLGNLGKIYAQQGESGRGERFLNEAIEILEKVEDYNAITDFLFSMAMISSERGEYDNAIAYAERSLQAAQKNKLKPDLDEVNLLLSKLYEEVGNIPEAYTHYKQHVTYKDSVENIAAVEEMANLRTNFELSRKQTEIDLLNEQKANQRNIVIATAIALFLIMLLALGLYRRNKYIGRTKKIIEREKNRSDRLLLNILPQETALELKEKGRVSAQRFEAVTILFTDFRNFTHYAENLSPEELVKTVDYYFSRFDEIIESHGLEKIKTVGDAYMCAAGVPFPVKDHAEKIILAACDMVNFVREAHHKKLDGETRFDIRIGVNSGPVVAGVVGSKKWAYDIWGDAVNIAARMETCSEVGKINISENTFELIKEKFDCHYRGEIMVKNKGMMKMYFIKENEEVVDEKLAYDELPKM
ncbi:adenylate/guanylate cyclase domain-containing protein [Salinimicrobium oceani]|uniref:Tetratricopeptide repeat protein n=1 Tax=Salinimicrobium oceani TaxID=2722702 RepID=A0ABX1CW23_9FLAO|nr:adenylate/guanylate cyclase domain-containing protein [Salinimicrobium oceani]NJW52495.1 tetratricopeptide repeat protein [Salinimicrobium oceani]